jgi:hypothetical protein
MLKDQLGVPKNKGCSEDTLGNTHLEEDLKMIGYV